MTYPIRSPYPFTERICVFGPPGSGKSSITLSIANRMPDADFFVIDNDVSHSYERLIYLEWQDIMDRESRFEDQMLATVTTEEGDEVEVHMRSIGNVHLIEIGASWEEFEATVKAVTKIGNSTSNWLTVDSTSPTWQYVQSWFSTQVHGTDLADHMTKLRRETKDSVDAQGKSNAITAFNKELSGEMTWPLINKHYNRFYALLQRWRGSFVLTAEADIIGKQASEDEKERFGRVGYNPVGQKRLTYVSATNLYIDATRTDRRLTTIDKDRGRERVEKMPFDDFAEDYLVGIAGWEVVAPPRTRRKKAEAETAPEVPEGDAASET